MGGELHVIGIRAFMQALPVDVARNSDIILRELRARPLVSRDELLDALYGDRPDGGPEYASDTLNVEIWLLRKRGYPIVCSPTRGWSLGQVGG